MHLQNICEFVFHADFVPFIEIQLYSKLAIFDVSQNKTCPKTRLLPRIMKQIKSCFKLCDNIFQRKSFYEFIIV